MDIVQRLNRGEGCLEGDGQTCIRMDAESGCICAIAADTITRLTARVRELETALQWYASETNWLNPERARAALSASQPAPPPVRTDSRYNNAERIFGDD